jgi:hypothetical protein
MQSFENPYEACKEAHHSCTYGMGWVRPVWLATHIWFYAKACFCFDGRNILNGPALEKSDLCIKV